MGTGIPGNTEHAQGPPPKSPWWGRFALLLLVINAAITIGSYFASGTGVDSAIGFAYVFLVITFPGLLFTVVLATRAVIRNEGRITGAIALTVSGGAVLFCVYGFLST